MKRNLVVGDVLEINGHRGLLLVVESEAVESRDHTRGGSYYGDTFDTVTMTSFALTKGPNPKVKKFCVAGGSISFVDREQRHLAEIKLVGYAPVKKQVQVSYKVGGFKKA